MRALVPCNECCVWVGCGSCMLYVEVYVSCESRNTHTHTHTNKHTHTHIQGRQPPALLRSLLNQLMKDKQQENNYWLHLTFTYSLWSACLTAKWLMKQAQLMNESERQRADRETPAVFWGNREAPSWFIRGDRERERTREREREREGARGKMGGREIERDSEGGRKRG